MVPCEVCGVCYCAVVVYPSVVCYGLVYADFAPVDCVAFCCFVVEVDFASVGDYGACVS